MPRKARTQSLKIPAPAPKPVFDISSRFMAETIQVPIMDTLVDRKRDTGMRVVIRSSQSDQARDAGRAFRASIVIDGDGMTATQIDDLFLAQLVAVTVSWSGFTSAGTEIECTPANVRALYGNPQAAWIYQQVFAAFMDTARFFATPRPS